MKKFVSIALAVLLLTSALTACTPVSEMESVSASADGIAKYTAYLEENLSEMPDSLVVATAEDAPAYGVDMSEFLSDGYFTRADSGDVVILGKTDEGLDRAVRDFVNYGNADSYFKVYNEGYRVKRITLAGYDISEYSIVIPEDATENVRFAAENIRSYTEKACGVNLAITSGDTPHAIRFIKDKSGDLGEQGFTIATTDGQLTITHGDGSGALNGAMTFLEEYMGWRFVYQLNANVYQINGGGYIDYVYESEHLVIESGIADTQLPVIEYRDSEGRFKMDEWSYKLKYSGEYSRNSKYGALKIFSHSAHGLAHGEFNELILNDGASMNESGFFNRNICFVDEGNIAITTEIVLRKADALVASGVDPKDICIDISQLDIAYFCSCSDCKNLTGKEGSRSATVLTMANYVAGELNAKYPGAYVSIFAYCGTSKPPKTMTPNENVKVDYCFYVDVTGNSTACGAHCYDGSECMPGYYNDICGNELKKWSEISTKVYVWVYVEAYYQGFVEPQFRKMLADYQFFADCGIDGVFQCGAIPYYTFLSNYMFMKLTWDPYISEIEYLALIEEYFRIVCGDASGEAMYDYFLMWCKSGETLGCFEALHATGTADKGDPDYYKANYETMISLFDYAEKYAETSFQEKTVRKLRCHMEYLGLYAIWDDYYVNGTEEQRDFVDKRYRMLWDLAMEFNFPEGDYERRSFPQNEADMDFTKCPSEYLG